MPRRSDESVQHHVPVRSGRVRVLLLEPPEVTHKKLPIVEKKRERERGRERGREGARMNTTTTKKVSFHALAREGS